MFACLGASTTRAPKGSTCARTCRAWHVTSEACRAAHRQSALQAVCATDMPVVLRVCRLYTLHLDSNANGQRAEGGGWVGRTHWSIQERVASSPAWMLRNAMSCATTARPWPLLAPNPPVPLPQADALSSSLWSPARLSSARRIKAVRARERRLQLLTAAVLHSTAAHVPEVWCTRPSAPCQASHGMVAPVAARGSTRTRQPRRIMEPHGTQHVKHRGRGRGAGGADGQGIRDARVPA